MNRKNKKRITTVAVALFFLAGGIWYFAATADGSSQQDEETTLTGVLETIRQEASITPQMEPDSLEKEEIKTLVVYVCGAVNQPGVYELSEDSRLYEAVTLAGGFSPEADAAYHNLARNLSDGERIYILSTEETKLLTTMQQVEGEEKQETNSSADGTKINLNTATAEQLTSLPGIGEAKALAIIEYRNKAGRFESTEEIKNVSGIGEAMYEKIKDKIMIQ